MWYIRRKIEKFKILYVGVDSGVYEKVLCVMDKYCFNKIVEIFNLKWYVYKVFFDIIF